MLALLLLACVASGGCSVTLPMFSADKSDLSEKSIALTTASVKPAKGISPLSPELGTEDWRRAAGAMALALDPQGNGAAVNWDNPESGTKGVFSPVSGPVLRSDEICRAFLSTIVLQTGASKMQGTACRPSGGEWSIKEIAPWKG
jgi:surface antigen